MTSSTDCVIAPEPVNDTLLKELELLYPGDDHKAMIWHWQYGARFERQCLTFTARVGGRLVGFNGLMPISLQVNGIEHRAWWSCDFVVAPEFQGQGIGRRLKDEMLHCVQEPILSMGISEKALPILLGKGWRLGSDLPLYERVFSPSRKRQWLLRMWGDCIAGPQQIIQRILSAQQWVVTEHTHLPSPARVNRIWQCRRPEKAASIVKDHDYLTWRYECFPGNVYRFLLVKRRRGSELTALVIYRADQDAKLEIVDYLGPDTDAGLVQAVARTLRRQGARSLAWRVHSPLLQRTLWLSGFVKSRYTTQFVFRSLPEAEGDHDWHLSSGDSDGDFLRSAQYYFPAGAQSAGRFYMSIADEETLANSRAVWTRLLQQSNANPLFMSWLWQSTWWSVWGHRLGLDLRCYFIYEGLNLVGIVPLFRAPRRRLEPEPLHFIGNAWRLAPSVRSEYIGPVFDREKEAKLYDFVAHWVGRLPGWSYMMIPDHTGPIKHWPNALVRQKDTGYRLSTEGDLQEYLKTLGRHTRMRAFNRQSYLFGRYPDAQWEAIPHQPQDLSLFFRALNDFHAQRWGRPCFQKEAVDFHCRLIQGSDSSIQAVLHALKVGGRIRSVSYNLITEGVMYNIQSGFEDGFDRKLSLGTLHFGKLIGMCFSDPNIVALDFLAGEGKNTDYKRRFSKEKVGFFSVQLFPNRSVLRGYKLIAWLKAKMRNQKELH